MSEPPPETVLELHGSLTRALLSGTKRVTIRKGHRNFTKHITIAKEPATIASVKHYTLMHVPFEIFQREGFTTMFRVLMGLKKFYPDIDLKTPVTVIEFTIDLPIHDKGSTLIR